MTQHHFTDKQLAQRYLVSRQTIWRWVKEEKFPSPIRLSKSCTRWTAESVMQWEQSRADQNAARVAS